MQTSVQKAIHMSHGEVQQKYHGECELARQDADLVADYKKQSDHSQKYNIRIW
jgi:hypothetical protein